MTDRKTSEHADNTVTVTTIELNTSDNVRLAAQLYSTGRPARLTILMLPGIGVPQRAFRHLARWLALRGTRCVTVDYRGMGASANPQGIKSATLSAWARRDAAAAMKYCKKAWSQPVVLIGHSFGGQSVGLAKALHDVRAAVFIGSQFGQARYWDGVARWRLAVYWRVFLPLVSSLFRVLPRWTGPAGPLPGGVAREWSLWGRSRDWYISRSPESADLLARFSAPILAYGISDDPIAPPRAVSAFLEKFQATIPHRRHIDPRQIGVERIGHTGLLRSAPENEPIWQEMLDFLLRESRHVEIEPFDAFCIVPGIEPIREGV